MPPQPNENNGTLTSMSLSRREFFAGFCAQPAQDAPSFDPPVTPTDRFFKQYTHPVPEINSAFWSCSIGGLVTHPLTLSYADLLSLPALDLPCTLLCASNRPGGERIGHAVWRGVPVELLLAELDIHPGARFARLESADGSITGIPLERLRTALLAYEMNGELLRPEHGFPARLIVPGLYDHKMPRWIERIALMADSVQGAWENRGWSPSGIVETTSGITSPRTPVHADQPVPLSGYAFAGDRTITAIEISVDGGPWVSLPFTAGPQGAWTPWSTTWTPPAAGDYQLRVRASDSSGDTQGEAAVSSFPVGSSAIHAITISVRGRAAAVQQC